MRIFKYLLLIFLLGIVGLSVYIATQKSEFEITTHGIVKARKSMVFDYINDFKNWETFNPYMMGEKANSFHYLSKTIGYGALCSWKHGFNDIIVKTKLVREYDSISYNIDLDGAKGDISFGFKDTIGGTKITIHCKGKLNTYTKAVTFFSGGISSVLENAFEKTLQNLDRVLNYELKKYSIKVNNITKLDSIFFIKQTFTCKKKVLTKNVKIILSKLNYFFKKNDLVAAGKPFVIYENNIVSAEAIKVSVCMPINKEIFITTGSEFDTGKMESYSYLKTILTGDYSHREEAWKKAKKYLIENNLKENSQGKYLEILTKTIEDIKKPSMWITEIYIPVYPKEILIPKTVGQDDDNTNNVTVATPTEENIPTTDIP